MTLTVGLFFCQGKVIANDFASISEQFITFKMIYVFYPNGSLWQFHPFFWQLVKHTLIVKIVIGTFSQKGSCMKNLLTVVFFLI